MRTTIEVRPYEWRGPYAEWRSTARHDPGLCAEVRASWMAPEERLILRSCEMIGHPEAFLYDDHVPAAEPDTRGKQYRHASFQWDPAKAPAQVSADCTVQGKGRFSLVLRGEDDCLEIELSVRNDLSKAMGPIDWAFCAVALESPTLRDPEHDRTFVFDGERLRSFRSINGRPGIHMIRVAGGEDFIPDGHRQFPVSETVARESVVIIGGRDGRHAAGLGFEQSYNSYGCTGNMCFHMDPWFGTLAANGQEKRMRGRLYLVEGDAEEVLKRYRRDFGCS